MKNILFWLSTVALLLLVNACSTQETNSSTTSFTPCKEPRSQFCTREYRPVCAILGKSSKQKTYSNACTACADNYVIGYNAESCPE